MKYRFRVGLAVFAFALLAATGPWAAAATVAIDMTQYATTSGPRWKVVDTTPTFTSPQGLPILPTDTNAHGGDALLSDFSGTGGRVTYDFVFSEAGTYYVYLHYSMFDSTNSVGSYGNEDSIFMSHELGTPLDTLGALDIYDFDPQSHTVPGVGYWDGIFHWDQVSLRSSPLLTYTATAADVGALQTLEINNRENGAVIDYIILSTDSGLTERQLNGIIPEPSTVALLATGGLTLLGLAWRKRRARGN